MTILFRCTTKQEKCVHDEEIRNMYIYVYILWDVLSWHVLCITCIHVHMCVYFTSLLCCIMCCQRYVLCICICICIAIPGCRTCSCYSHSFSRSIRFDELICGQFWSYQVLFTKLAVIGATVTCNSLHNGLEFD